MIQILSELDVGVDAVRREILEDHPVLSDPVSPTIELPLGEDAKAILGRAAQEAEHLEHSSVRGDHLLLAILCVEHCSAARRLARNGLEAAPVRDLVRRLAAE